jgi:hypothetical protein
MESRLKMVAENWCLTIKEKELNLVKLLESPKSLDKNHLKEVLT